MAGDDIEKADDAGRLPIPEIDKRLIAWLVATHPQRVIKPTETLEQAHRRAGFQDCIDLLTHYQQLQALALTDEGEEVAGELFYEVPDPDQPLVAIRLGEGRVLRSTRPTARP